MGSLGHTLQIDLPRDWVDLALPGRVEGGGQLLPVVVLFERWNSLGY